jgi:ribonuclease VapC
LILDTSAVVAIICREAGHESLLKKIANARMIAIGAPTVAETQMALTIKLGRNGVTKLDQFLSEIQAGVVPFGRTHLSVFYDAFQRYGKGRHPAALNMGDCFTYAIAKAAGLPLLFVGNDFSKTDLPAA